MCLYWLMPAAKPFDDGYCGDSINASMGLEPRRTHEEEFGVVLKLSRCIFLN